MIILTNAFSINMLCGNSDVSFRQITKEEAREVLANGFTSAIGHNDTANVVATELGIDVVPNRVSVKMGYDTTLIVAQYTGSRLPEGATTLPDGATITYWKVTM